MRLRANPSFAGICPRCCLSARGALFLGGLGGRTSDATPSVCAASVASLRRVLASRGK